MHNRKSLRAQSFGENPCTARVAEVPRPWPDPRSHSQLIKSGQRLAIVRKLGVKGEEVCIETPGMSGDEPCPGPRL
jgi:hypothetical protein